MSKCSEKVTNEVLERIGEKRRVLNNILRRKVNWIGHIPNGFQMFKIIKKTK